MGPEVRSQRLDVASPGVEARVDAGRPHEQVVGPPQVLGQGVPTEGDEALQRLRGRQARAQVKSKKYVGDGLDLGPARRSTQPARRNPYFVSSCTNWVRTSRAIDGRPVTASVPANAADRRRRAGTPASATG